MAAKFHLKQYCNIEYALKDSLTLNTLLDTISQKLLNIQSYCYSSCRKTLLCNLTNTNHILLLLMQTMILNWISVDIAITRYSGYNSIDFASIYSLESYIHPLNTEARSLLIRSFTRIVCLSFVIRSVRCSTCLDLHSQLNHFGSHYLAISISALFNLYGPR